MIVPALRSSIPGRKARSKRTAPSSLANTFGAARYEHALAGKLVTEYQIRICLAHASDLGLVVDDDELRDLIAAQAEVET
jgi:hypothetical protein